MNTEVVCAVIAGVFSLLAATLTWKKQNGLVWILVVILALFAGTLSYIVSRTVGGHYATGEYGQSEAVVYMDGFAKAKVWYIGHNGEDTYSRSIFSSRWYRDGDNTKGYFERSNSGEILKFTNMRGTVQVWTRK